MGRILSTIVYMSTTVQSDTNTSGAIRSANSPEAAMNINAIFAENVSNPDLMASIAAEAGVTLAPTLYTDSLGAPDSGADTYIRLIESNTNAIVAALSGP